MLKLFFSLFGYFLIYPNCLAFAEDADQAFAAHYCHGSYLYFQLENSAGQKGSAQYARMESNDECLKAQAVILGKVPVIKTPTVLGACNDRYFYKFKLTPDRQITSMSYERLANKDACQNRFDTFIARSHLTNEEPPEAGETMAFTATYCHGSYLYFRLENLDGKFGSTQYSRMTSSEECLEAAKALNTGVPVLRTATILGACNDRYLYKFSLAPDLTVTSKNYQRLANDIACRARANSFVARGAILNKKNPAIGEEIAFAAHYCNGSYLYFRLETATGQTGQSQYVRTTSNEACEEMVNNLSGEVPLIRVATVLAACNDRYLYKFQLKADRSIEAKSYERLNSAVACANRAQAFIARASILNSEPDAALEVSFASHYCNGSYLYFRLEDANSRQGSAQYARMESNDDCETFLARLNQKVPLVKTTTLIGACNDRYLYKFTLNPNLTIQTNSYERLSSAESCKARSISLLERGRVLNLNPPSAGEQIAFADHYCNGSYFYFRTEDLNGKKGPSQYTRMASEEACNQFLVDQSKLPLFRIATTIGACNDRYLYKFEISPDGAIQAKSYERLQSVDECLVKARGLIIRGANINGLEVSEEFEEPGGAATANFSCSGETMAMKLKRSSGESLESLQNTYSCEEFAGKLNESLAEITAAKTFGLCTKDCYIRTFEMTPNGVKETSKKLVGSLAACKDGALALLP